MSGSISKECDRLRERLPEYAEGKLVGRPRAQLERHLAGCSRCAAEVGDLRTVIGAVRAIPAHEAPEDLVGRVRAALLQRAPAPAAPKLLWPRLAVPVAVLTGAVAIALVLRTPSTRQLAPGVIPPAKAIGEVQPGGPPGRAGGGFPMEPAAETRRTDLARPEREQQGPADGAAAPWAEEKLDARPVQPPPPAAAPTPPTGPPARPGEGRRRETPPVIRDASPRVGNRKLSGRTGLPGPRHWEDDRATLGRPEVSAEADAYREGEAPTGKAGAYRGTEAATAEPTEAYREAEAPAAKAPPAPLSARVSLASAEAGKIIALKLTAQQPLEEITLTLNDGAPQAFSWQGRAGEPAWIPLSAENIGPGPAAIRIRFEAGEGLREYVLFVPVLARLGESAASAPLACYKGIPLPTVLADLSALTGLVVLAESPLDIEFSGELPSGDPGAVLELLAADVGFDAHAEGELAYTLTHSR